MKRIHDSKRSAVSAATDEKCDKCHANQNPKGHNSTGRSSGRGQRWRSRGIMTSQLLLVGLLTIAVFAAPTASRAASVAVGISVGIAPPPIPVYTQPACPGPGFMWTPGYWAYDPANGYFWVPGTWAVAPAVGLLWTPGYWGWGGAAFIWHGGYWGPHIGFYGGINYGFGYTGHGYEGGYWRGRDFFYNRSVNNINVTHITNVYNRTVVNNFAVNRVSYNGGAGGLRERPTSGELAAEHDRHVEATSGQHQYEMTAHNERSQFASVNHGRPGVAATGRPGEFRGGNAVASTRAGGSVSSGGYHGTNSGHTNGSSGSHNPNPGGGGTHQVMTAHQSSPTSHGLARGSGGTAPGPNHSISAPHNEASHGAASTTAASAAASTEGHAARFASFRGGRNEPHGK